MSEDLRSISQCVELRVFMSKGWPQSTTDLVESAAVAERKGSKARRSRVVKKLFDNEHTRAISSVYNAVSQWLGRNALPTKNRGVFLLPVGRVIEATEALDKFRGEVDKHVCALRDSYEQWLQKERDDLDSWFDPHDYPSADTVAAGTSLGYVMVPTPDLKSFGDVFSSEKLAERLREQYEDMVRSQNEEIIVRLRDRWRDAMQEAIERGDKYHHGDAKRLHTKSLIGKLEEEAEILREINILQDEVLTDALTAGLANLPKDPEELKNPAAWEEAKLGFRRAIQVLDSEKLGDVPKFSVEKSPEPDADQLQFDFESTEEEPEAEVAASEEPESEPQPEPEPEPEPEPPVEEPPAPRVKLAEINPATLWEE